MGGRWAEEQKALQAEKIRNWKPWRKSIGPKTAAGKKRCKMNAWRSRVSPEDYKNLNEGPRWNAAFLRMADIWSAARLCSKGGPVKIHPAPKIKGSNY